MKNVVSLRSRWSCALFCWLLTDLAVAKPPQVDPSVLKILLQSGAIRLTQLPQCEPFSNPEATPTLPRSKTLTDDLSASLAALSKYPVVVEAQCSPADAGRRLCNVQFTVNHGEHNWTRFYQFMLSRQNKLVDLQDFKCMNLP